MRTTSQIQEVGSGLQSRPDEQEKPNLQPPLPGLDKIVKPFRFAPSPYVYKVVPLREARTPDQMTLCDTPEAAAAYWRLHVPQADAFDPECECFTVLLLNTRRRIKAHHLVSVGIALSEPFRRFPSFSSNADEMRQLKAELYKLLLPVVQGKKMVEIADRLLKIRSA